MVTHQSKENYGIFISAVGGEHFPNYVARRGSSLKIIEHILRVGAAASFGFLNFLVPRGGFRGRNRLKLPKLSNNREL